MEGAAGRSVRRSSTSDLTALDSRSVLRSSLGGEAAEAPRRRGNLVLPFLQGLKAELKLPFRRRLIFANSDLQKGFHLLIRSPFMWS